MPVAGCAAHSPAGTTIHLPVVEYLLTTAPINLPGRCADRRAPLPHARRRPDYVVVPERDERVRLLVVECKGASGEIEKSVDQLGSAMHQLAAIRFDPPGGQRSYRSAATPTRRRLAGTRSDRALWIRSGRATEPRIDLNEGGDDRDFAALTRHGPVIVHDTPALTGEMVRCARERAAAWAGLEAEPVAPTTVELEPRDAPFGEIGGASSTFELTGRLVRIFTGALVEVHDVPRAGRDTEPRRPRGASGRAR